MKQHDEAFIAQKETEDRVAAAVLLTGYIAELLPEVLQGLKQSGYLLDEIQTGNKYIKLFSGLFLCSIIWRF